MFIDLFIGSEEGSQNKVEITSETSNRALTAAEYATPSQGTIFVCSQVPYLIIIFKYLVRERIPMEEKMKV